MHTEDVIEREFKTRELAYIDAVLRLQQLGWASEDAEDQVEEWERERPALSASEGT